MICQTIIHIFASCLQYCFEYCFDLFNSNHSNQNYNSIIINNYEYDILEENEDEFI
jgi:hypothetical protein